jgi:hypothetical protein
MQLGRAGGHLRHPRRAPPFVHASERRRAQASDARHGRIAVAPDDDDSTSAMADASGREPIVGRHARSSSLAAVSADAAEAPPSVDKERSHDGPAGSARLSGTRAADAGVVADAPRLPLSRPGSCELAPGGPGRRCAAPAGISLAAALRATARPLRPPRNPSSLLRAWLLPRVLQVARAVILIEHGLAAAERPPALRTRARVRRVPGGRGRG